MNVVLKSSINDVCNMDDLNTILLGFFLGKILLGL